MRRARADELRLLGTRIKELRVKRGLSRQQLAKRADIHYQFMGGIERGSENPTLTVLWKVAAALRVPITDLFGYDPQVRNPAQMRRRLIEGIRRCSDSEVALLYRVYRSL
jgi:transcriptional regulator with XRE-family HTH domain